MKQKNYFKVFGASLLFLLLSGCYTVNKPFLVTVDKFNLLYLNLPNPIYVWTSSANKNLVLETDNGTIEAFKDKYFITPSKPGKGTIRIRSGKKELGEWYFRAITPDQPISAKIAGRPHTIDPYLVSDYQGLMVVHQMDYEVNIDIVSFDFVLKRNNEVIQQVHNPGSRFVEAVRSTIQNGLKTGDVIVFDNIVGKYPNGNSISLNSITITVPDKF